jgi:hypothetical protein
MARKTAEKPALVFLTLLLALSGMAGCGGGGEGEDPMAKYSGSFSVLEMFQSQDGASCPDPTSPDEYSVNIKIEKNDFAATFSERWGKTSGEIGADLNFVAANTDPIPGLALQLTGGFLDVDSFEATMRELMQGCTRFRTLSGTRQGG